MDLTPFDLLAPLAAVAVNALAQALDFRLRRALAGSYVSGLMAGLVFLAATLAATGLPPGPAGPALALLDLGIYCGFWLCFVAVVGLGISLRMRVLGYLDQAGRPVPEAELEARFEGNMMLRRRIDRLIQGGHVREQDGRLVSAGSWLTRVALLNAAIKTFLTGHHSEFRQG